MVVSLPRRLFLSVAALLLAAGCASTTVDGTWTRPDVAGQRIQGPVMVVGIARDETIRRIYEDDMVAKLAARGVKARQSYLVEPGVLDHDSPNRLLAEARRGGERWLLSTVVIGMDMETTITTSGAWPYPAFAGYRGWYGAYWGMAWPVYSTVRNFPILIAQTALTRVDTEQVDWVARTRSTEPANIESGTRGFVDVILGAMAKDGLVAAAK